MNQLLRVGLLLLGYAAVGIAAEVCDESSGCQRETMNKTVELSTSDGNSEPSSPSYPAQVVPATSSVSIICNASEGAAYNGWMLVQGSQDIDLPNDKFENIKVEVEDGVETLQIHHIRPEQAGTYVCETQQPSGIVEFLKLQIQVNADHLETTGAETVTAEYETLSTGSSISEALVSTTDIMETLQTTTLSSEPKYVGGCRGTRYGCCKDGRTAASGYNSFGCPEKSEVVVQLVFPTTADPRQVVLLKTDNPRQAVESHGYPRNFKIVREVVASDRVIVIATWDETNPESEYTLRFSEDVNIGRDYWGKISPKTNKYETALRRPSTYYFTIEATSGEMTAESPVYVYYTEDEMSREYSCGPDNCLTTTESVAKLGCRSTRWGCCLDGVTTALGPDGSGCPVEESCDVSDYECCPDGITKARGDNFEGCADRVTLPVVVSPLCLEAHNTTLCTKYDIQWFYDSERQRCRRFWYGGCEGSSNTFSTQAGCNAVCSSQYRKEEGPACSQVSGLVGICKGRYRRWTYNNKTNQCEQFDYGGCHGNDNNFLTANDCQRQCLNMEEGKDVCSMPPESGPCYARFSRWYYNADEQTCKEFVYGGCRGNENRFWSRDDCLRRCTALEDRKPQEICLLPEVRGSCERALPQYSYDPTTRTCSLFIYGGCDGNGNRFPNPQACLATCGPNLSYGDESCLLPPQAGPCNGNYPRWYYDSVSDECRQFVFGGCQGNSNNYQSEEECKSSCVQEQRTTDTFPINNVCMLDYDAGSCDGYVIRYFYDKDAEVCRRFVYTGCGGNSNRFSDEASCELACGKQVPVTTTERGPVTTSFEQAAVITNPEDVRQTAYIGERATLRCEATGVPLPSFSWYKNGYAIDTARDPRYQLVDGNLIISRVTADDMTQFVCRAYNGVGSSDDLYVNFIVEDEINIEKPYEEVIAVLGSNLSLRCNATKSPATVIIWKFQGLVLANSREDNSSLDLTRLTRADGGNYFCTAENDVRWAQKVVSLTVVDPLRISLEKHKLEYEEGQRLILTCLTDSYLPVSVQWRKDGALINAGGRISIEGDSLMVGNMLVSDTGEYSCLAANSLESREVSTSITVQTSVTTPEPVTGPCGDRSHLANCKLVVYYGYCKHEVYRHLCCQSCVDSGQISRSEIRPSRYSINSLYRYRSNQPSDSVY